MRKKAKPYIFPVSVSEHFHVVIIIKFDVKSKILNMRGRPGGTPTTPEV